MPIEPSKVSSIRRLATKTTALPTDVTPKGPKAGVLNVSLRLFAENGYAGASIRDIASAAGLKPASIYAHYSSKEEILVSLMNIGHEEHFLYVHHAVMNAEPNPVALLRAYVDGHVRFHAEYAMLAMLVNHELHSLSPEHLPKALSLREQATRLLMDIVRQGQEKGVFDIGHDPWLAGAAIGAMGMRVAHWYSENHEKSLEELVSSYQDFACRMVGVTDQNR